MTPPLQSVDAADGAPLGPGRALLTTTTAALLAAALAGCGSASIVADRTTATRPSPSGSASTVAGPSSPSSSPAASPTTTATPAAPRPRTDAELTTALLAIDDLPPGWAVEPAGQGGADGASPTMAATSAACRDFVSLGNASSAPGSTASAASSFSAGQDGPFVDEGIDALGSRAEVAALLARVESANRSCRTVTLALPGVGRSTVDVVVVSPPRVGDHPVAVRLTARGGDLDGLELTQVVTGVDDTVVSLIVMGGGSDDVSSSTEAAVDKAVATLGVTAAGV